MSCRLASYFFKKDPYDKYYYFFLSIITENRKGFTAFKNTKYCMNGDR
jgi:hypothetical protein